MTNHHIGRPTTIEANGRTYTIGRFTRNILFRFMDWAEAQIPDPLDDLKTKITGFPPHIQELMVKDALQKSRVRRSVQSPEVQQLLGTPEGAIKILQLLLSKNHPELSESEVGDIFDSMIEEHGGEY